MRAVDIIIKKRDHQELTNEEIEWFISGFTRGEIPDYQASAWAMAVLLNGMNERETTSLTIAMANSGELLDLARVVPYAVDKHSTGGVGDKTTLVVAPLVASCGLAVGKMSGRGLGFSGGTLDKLESIPGYKTELSTEEFLTQLERIGIVVCGQSKDLAPADGKLYALRDVTGTVQSIPLIASSIMSKKIAAGAQAIVLDVKVGLGAFMKNLEDARYLGDLMVEIGRQTGRKAVAYLSDMNQPLGKAVGNAIELKEAIQTLQLNGPADFQIHCIEIASQMLLLGKIVNTLDDAKKLATSHLESGKAWDKFEEWIHTQGGDVRTINNLELLPKAETEITILAEKSGYIQQIHAEKVGLAAVYLGAGREKKGDPIDYGVGLLVNKKVGEEVRVQEPIFKLYVRKTTLVEPIITMLREATSIKETPVEPYPLFYGVIE